MNEEITLEELRGMATRAGLTLSEDELQRLLPGVNRARKQAAELRPLISMTDEPTGTFNAAIPGRK
jgi:hypothetical protein